MRCGTTTEAIYLSEQFYLYSTFRVTSKQVNLKCFIVSKSQTTRKLREQTVKKKKKDLPEHLLLNNNNNINHSLQIHLLSVYPVLIAQYQEEEIIAWG